MLTNLEQKRIIPKSAEVFELIITETVNINGKELRKTYSDSNLMIRKVGTDKLYCEAIDVLDAAYTYEETGISINEDDIAAAEALQIITGR